MRLTDLVDKLSLEVRSAQQRLDTEVTGGYASDLLSDVIGNSREGNVWVTLQIHQNIIAVASMKDLAAIILVSSREPEEDTVQKAQNENIPLLISKLPAFELVGRLYALGVRGAGGESTD